MSSISRWVWYTFGGKVNWCSPEGEQFAGFSKTWKQSYYLTQQFHSCVYIWRKRKYWLENIVCCYSITKSCPTLCNPMDYSTPGSPVLHCLPDSCPLSWWCYLTISSCATPFFLCLFIFPESRSFPINQFFASGGQSIGASASAPVFPMNV